LIERVILDTPLRNGVISVADDTNFSDAREGLIHDRERYKHGQHLDYNLPKIKAYNVANAGTHYAICARPVDDNARLTNLLLTMMNKMEVRTEKFADSLGPISDLMA